MSANLVQNEQSQTAFYHLCKMESAFAAVWIFCVLAHNCEADKILCTPSNRSGLKKIKLNQKESLLLSVVPDNVLEVFNSMRSVGFFRSPLEFSFR